MKSPRKLKKKLLSIDARMLFAGGIGTYEQELLKRMNFDELGLPVEIYYRTEKEKEWLAQHQPKATLKHCPHWIYKPAEQFYWMQHLRGGVFWAPHYNIPFFGYEKLVVTLHDGAFALTKHVPWFYNLYAGIMFWWINLRANAALAVSAFGKRMSIENGKLTRVPICVTNLGVDEAWFAPAKPESPYPFPYFVYVGNIKPHKNLTRMLQAYKLANPGIKLVCIGSFKNLKFKDKAAEQLMKEMGTDVIFVDEMRGEGLREVIKHSAGLILPSLYETFSMPPTEAMAAGVPVLSSRIPSMTELHGNHVIYCDPYRVEDIANGILELRDLRGAKRDAQIKAAQEHIRQFVWEKTARETMDVLKKVLAE